MHAKRIAHEILNGREHAGDHFRIEHAHRLGHHMLEQEARLPVNEEDLFDAIAQGMQQHNFGEGHAGPQGF
jgi:hypothetical protein